MGGDSGFSRLKTFLVTRVTALFQGSDTVYVRLPGDRFLTGPHPAGPPAMRHWQFAMISEAAYGRSLTADQKATQARRSRALARFRRKAVETVDVDGELNKAGWDRWVNQAEFSQSVIDKMKKAHLRVEVWQHPGQGLLVVAFGGTVFTSGADWRANLRWFWPTRNDEYTVLVKAFAPDFSAVLRKKRAGPQGAWLHAATLCSTGHSLGGGLAQQFAYALPLGETIQPVAHVYAFDPSPVTGFYSVEKATRERNATGLAIERIYERGEVLAILRSLTSLLWPPTAGNPVIQGTRYSFFFSLDAIGSHSMVKLAVKMQEAAGVASHDPHDALVSEMIA